ncbi:phosphate ABC transporter ATP-binding protein [Alkalihalobacillus sp. AL-G]|uniref:ABC transporter ATP-binding protein n=1 Tax=Alkalihalobacillus sp. AL-G TaxID=2926399 RepID=UPI00272C596B|nr:phosphate ABC transporter ATP-binding protein [Alkalihalobacillus sp. AL-G]WLD92059.1 phosphate ABC transporter ATP-binding protein [Alkalihalobacillus sp. AL-G]
MELNSVIRCEKVTTEVLDQFTFCFPEKQMTTIIGPSGAGKSSLLMLLNRLNEPREGDIFYKERHIKDYPIIELRREIGIVFQSAYLFDGTVEENLKYGPSLQNRWNSDMTGRLLDLVDLPVSFKTRSVTSLSGGEKQRVALARTLANEPSILLLDEVTSSLDIKTTEIIEHLLQRIKDEDKITVVMVTHNIEQTKRISDFTMYLQDGCLIESGPTDQILEKPSTSQLQEFLKE